MKNKIFTLTVLAGSLFISSCEDFLTHENTTMPIRKHSSTAKKR